MRDLEDFMCAVVTVIFGKGSNDAILNDGGRTTAVSLVGAHPDQDLRWGTALGHLLVVLPGNVSLQV
jgi:hypothetical protein